MLESVVSFLVVHYLGIVVTLIVGYLSPKIITFCEAQVHSATASARTKALATLAEKAAIIVQRLEQRERAAIASVASGKLTSDQAIYLAGRAVADLLEIGGEELGIAAGSPAISTITKLATSIVEEQVSMLPATNQPNHATGSEDIPG